MRADTKAIIEFMQHSFRLKRTRRTGWVREGVKHSESVSDHILGVVYLALATSRVEGFDENKIVKMALVHDVGESVVGDLVAERGTADQGIAKQKKEDEQAAVERILQPIRNDELQALAAEYLEGMTTEARFVKELDKLEMVMQALLYEAEVGDPNQLVEFWHNAAKYVHTTTGKDILRELKDRTRITRRLPDS